MNERGTVGPSSPAQAGPTSDIAAMVTLASLHGCGGGRIARGVAEQLDVPFLDRALPEAVAKSLGLPVAAVDAAEQPENRFSRVVRWLARTPNAATGDDPAGLVARQEHRIRMEVEDFLARASRTGGVVLGRGGAVVLKNVPGVLHVHLGGPWEARVHHEVEVENLDRRAAERAVATIDRARMGYVRDAYGVDGEDPRLYHLMLDATAFDTDSCVEIIVTASRACQAIARQAIR